MSIIRSPRPQTNFYILDKRISEDRRLSWEARGLLVFLLGKPDNWSVSVQALINETGDSGRPSKQAAVYATLKELVQFGYISKQKHQSGHLDYVVHETCSHIANSAVCEKPDMGKPDLGNQQLISTDVVISNEKENKDASLPACPVSVLVATYHASLPDNPKVKVLSEARKAALKARWKEAATLECYPFGYETQEDGISAWETFFQTCAQSKFLTGKAAPQPGKLPFLADLDFLLSPTGFVKCLENKYHREVQ